MANQSKKPGGGIKWCDETWNPIRGCSMVSPGCIHCYAQTVAHRYNGEGLPYEGLTTNGKWNGIIWRIPKHLWDPRGWQDPRRIFVNSMSDLFHENLEVDAIAEIFAVMALVDRHTYQVLTKRAERMRRILSDPAFWVVVARKCEEYLTFGGKVGKESSWVRQGTPQTLKAILERSYLPHVWLGVSAEDQQRANERVPLLLQTPAATRIVSYEPALGPVDFTKVPRCELPGVASGTPLLHWIIIGGESGNGARPFKVEWARSVISQCHAAGVAVFMKQMGALCFTDDGGYVVGAGGSWPSGTRAHVGTTIDSPRRVQFVDGHGADPLEWPEDLRVQEYPERKVA